MSVSPITSYSEFHTIIKGDKPVIIHFYAPWSLHAKQMVPVFAKLASERTKITFYKVDCSAQPEIAEEAGVNIMPTFLLYMKNTKLSGVDGPNTKVLTSLCHWY